MGNTGFLSRSIDYLGDLGAKLRDLQGYRTLVHELIQNADDVASANQMIFDVRNEALVVDNNGVFSDCGLVEASTCPWQTDGEHNHRCDFHRFRQIATGDKRGQSDTTGAFGIGFIATYQITDKPNLISVGRHWILREEESEDQRIEVCPGCERCSKADLPGTRFIFPWVRDSNSILRQNLRADAVAADGPDKLLEELTKSIPVAMLFLKRLRSVETKLNGATVQRMERIDEDDSILLTDGHSRSDTVWHVLHASFAEAALDLRAKHPTRIEAKRTSQVRVAIPDRPLATGLLCACLPSEHNTGLPFHIDADFFPTNDRKRIILGDDFQAEWNRAAVRAAVNALTGDLTALARKFGAVRFWSTMEQLKKVADVSPHNQGESVFSEFWRCALPKLKTGEVLIDTKGVWCRPEEARVLSQSQESASIEILEAIGARILHESLRPFQALIRNSGVALFDLEALCERLQNSGLDKRTEQAQLPSPLQSDTGLSLLWGELLTLWERAPKSSKGVETALQGLALAPGRDGALWPPSQTYCADDATVRLFEQLDDQITFVKRSGAFEMLESLCSVFGPTEAVHCLSRVGLSRLCQSLTNNPVIFKNVFSWLSQRQQILFAETQTTKTLVELPIFPSGAGLFALSEVALPGNFDDPLGIAHLVDLSILGEHRDFLVKLGIKSMDFPAYATQILPTTLSDDVLSIEQRRAAVLLLAKRLGEIKDDVSARAALVKSPLIECLDGQFRVPQDCYIDTATVRECLGDDINIAARRTIQERATRDLYDWLGVATEPRLDDVLDKIRELAAKPYSAASVSAIRTLFVNLGRRTIEPHHARLVEPLKRLKWLPARDRSDRWYAPNEIYAVYQAYLFESQALFLDLSTSAQSQAQTFLELIGVSSVPPPAFVSRHLLHCASQGTPVNREVYQFLNRNAQDPSISSLRDKKCLWVDGAYHLPNHLFWSPHPFGRFRCRLGEELRVLTTLLKALNVREYPTPSDSLLVLKDIVTEFAPPNKPLDEESFAVLMHCWRDLGKALENGDIAEAGVHSLRTLKCIPNAEHVLNRPEWMFIEGRGGLAAKFGEILSKNVIQKPLDIGYAYASAGVKTLSTAVQIELLDCVDPVTDEALAHRIESRKNVLARVLDSQNAGQGNAAKLRELASIQFVRADSIIIRYSISAFQRLLLSNPETVSALYQPDGASLLYCLREGELPWAPISRELAGALYPEEDPGRLAAGLRDALSPRSGVEAAALLDDLGFARLDDDYVEPASAEERVAEIGENAPLGETVSEDFVLGMPDKRGRLSGQMLVERSRQAPQPFGNEGNNQGSKEPSANNSNGSHRDARPVLRSYLPGPGTAEGEDLSVSSESSERSPVDICGVKRVLEHERAAGRFPLEMPHANPGYDVQSKDLNGEILRYIEVKSVSGAWSRTFAVLSRAQFEKARELGGLFWLYVVERALEEDFVVHRIPNPVLRANKFMFDDGWHEIAEFDLVERTDASE